MKASPSSTIAGHDYDAHSQTMHVHFRNGAVYHYSSVSPQEYARFVAAPSHGRHFLEHIKPHYKHTTVMKKFK